MTLADSIFSITRKLEVKVIINGVWLLTTSATGKAGVLGVHVKRNFDSPVPTCTITVDTIPEWIQRGYPVEVNLGFDGEEVRVFTGTVQDREHGIESGRINCVGRLYAVYRTVELPDRDVTGDPTDTAIADIFTYVGIDDGYVIPASGFTLGTASTALLRRSTSSQMIKTIMETELWRMYEDANGGIHIVSELTGPGVTAWRTYSTNTQATARIIGGRTLEDPGYARSRVKVTGATVIEGTPPNETSRTIESTTSLVGDAGIRPPLPAGSYADTELSNHLIDTDARADTIAGKLLTHYARVPRQVPLELPGDPQLEIGQTIGVEFPEQLLTGRWLVHGVEHIVNESGFVTRVDLRGGDEFGGIVRFNPRASFTYTVERETFGTKVWAFVTFDASASQGITADIASYAWADDETTTPEIATLTDAIVTVRIDPTTISDPWTVTLTVTDDDGLTGSFSLEIDVDVGALSVQIPGVFAAIDNYMSATPDGGQNWNDDADVDVLSVAAAPPDGVSAGRAVYGLDDGSIMLTTDFLATNAIEVKAAGGGGIRAIAWDWRNALIVWAVDDEANVYLSIDRGASWALYSALRTVLSLGSATLRSIGLPGGGGIWVYGGTGANNPLIAYAPDAGNPSWVNLEFGGDLASDLPAASADIRIVDAADNGGLAIIMENADAGDSGVRPIYHAVPNPYTPANWSRATGFDAGDVNGRYIVRDEIPLYFHAGFADRDVWHTTDAGATNWTENEDVLPANHAAHHCIWLREHLHGLFTSGVYLLALEDTS